MAGGFFFFLPLVAVFTMPFVHIDAIKRVKDNGNTALHKIVLGVCGVIILWTILTALREGLGLFW